LFDRKEVILGKLVGAGTYCNVYQVKAIQLLEMNGDMCLQWTRDCLAQNTRRRRKTGEARYCIKFLKAHHMIDKMFEEAASALHNEIEIFRSLRHNNICSVRAVAKQGSEAYYYNGKHDSYFWIMDRMVETLDDRILKWRSQQTKWSLSLLWRRRRGLAIDSSLCERMQVAYNMAQALEYLHRHRIVLRDVQPCKFGFSKEKAPIQLFDVTMARRLEDHNELFNDDHKKEASHRYMAPELLWGDVYDTKADVFSFLSIFYEMWTLQDLLSDVKPRCRMNAREVMLSPHFLLGDLFLRGWSIRPSDRPPMTVVCAALRKILRELEDGSYREEQDSSSFRLKVESSPPLRICET
jgi:serine/threonine protein kinase